MLKTVLLVIGVLMGVCGPVVMFVNIAQQVLFGSEPVASWDFILRKMLPEIAVAVVGFAICLVLG